VKIDVNFFKPFVKATQETFKVQCETEATPLKPYFKDVTQKSNIDIAGVIGLASPSFSGNISLCFSSSAFLGLMTNMLGEEYKEITPDLVDGAAELLNIIYGSAKTVIKEQGHDIDMAIPTVVMGKDLQTVHLSKGPTVVMPFETSAGQFSIEISIKSQG